MPEVTLYAPAIHCDHCIQTIRRAVDAQPGARFIDGSWESRSFNVEVENGAALDAVAAALAAEDYPLGEAGTMPPAAAPSAEAGASHPSYRVTRTDAGADVNYDCPCGCTAGFAFDRGKAEQQLESCCCGRTMLVGANAGERLRSALGDESQYYPVDVQTVTMPWGQPLEAALATPQESEHEAGGHDAGPSIISFEPARPARGDEPGHSLGSHRPPSEHGSHHQQH